MLVLISVSYFFASFLLVIVTLIAHTIARTTKTVTPPTPAAIPVLNGEEEPEVIGVRMEEGVDVGTEGGVKEGEVVEAEEAMGVKVVEHVKGAVNIILHLTQKQQTSLPLPAPAGHHTLVSLLVQALLLAILCTL